MSEILPPVIINNSPNIIIPTLHEDGNQVGPLFQTGTQGPIGPPGPIGPAGPVGPNIISDETQSDGTANISIAGLTISDSLTLNGENYSYSSDSLLAHRVALNIDEVDNTSDLDKPISTATQNALNNKVDKVEGKELSDENFTSAEKTKLDGIAEGAEVNVNADWTATGGDAEILNKPTLGSAAAANITDFATAAQGELADSALQPQSVNYLGEYNNGADYNPGAVVLYAGILYIRVGEANPGYPPGTSYWTEYNPEIGSPAYDLYVQTTLANKSNIGHIHEWSEIINKPDIDVIENSITELQNEISLKANSDGGNF
jgi:hypothetical protein